jgi:hypothetical protein
MSAHYREFAPSSASTFIHHKLNANMIREKRVASGFPPFFAVMGKRMD